MKNPWLWPLQKSIPPKKRNKLFLSSSLTHPSLVGGKTLCLFMCEFVLVCYVYIGPLKCTLIDFQRVGVNCFCMHVWEVCMWCKGIHECRCVNRCVWGGGVDIQRGCYVPFSIIFYLRRGLLLHLDLAVSTPQPSSGIHHTHTHRKPLG